MPDEDVPGRPIGVAGPVKDTDHFQVLLGPRGECRIALLDPASSEPFATLTLGATDADELARVLMARREAHAQAEGEERGGAKH